MRFDICCNKEMNDDDNSRTAITLSLMKFCVSAYLDNL